MEECSRETQASIGFTEEEVLDLFRSHLIDAHDPEEVHKRLEVESTITQFQIDNADSLGYWSNFVKKWSGCTDCRLGHLKNNTCVGSGSLNADLTVIGEAPGPREDREGTPFVGPTGTFLRETMNKARLFTEDVYFTNVLGCMPRDTRNSHFRAPMAAEVQACLPRLQEIHDRIASKSKVVLLLGKTAYLGWHMLMNPNINYSILQSKTVMNRVLGWQDYPGVGPQVYVSYHPSYIARQQVHAPESYRSIKQAWVNDLLAVNKYLTDGEIRNVRSV